MTLFKKFFTIIIILLIITFIIPSDSIYAITFFGVNSEPLDLLGSNPEIIIKDGNELIHASKLKNLIEYNPKMKEISILIKRNSDLFKNETVLIDKKSNTLFIKSFVIKKYSINFNFPAIDSNPDFPNYSVIIKDIKGNIISKQFSYKFENFSKLNTYNKIVNGERLFLSVFYNTDVSNSKMIYKQDFEADFENMPTILITKGMVPYCEFIVSDRAGHGFKSKYPIFFVKLSNSIFSFQKSNKTASDYKTIRFNKLPFLNNEKIDFKLFCKTSSENDPVLIRHKSIFVSKNLGFYRSNKISKNIFFKRIYISNFNSFKQNFIESHNFFLEIKSKTYNTVIPFNELCSQIILPGLRYNSKINFNVIRKVANKREILFTIKDFSKNSLIIPIIPNKNPTVIIFPNISFTQPKIYSISLIDNFGNIYREFKTYVLAPFKSISIPKGTFISNEPIKILVKDSSKLLTEKNITPGAFNKVFLPYNNDLTVFINSNDDIKFKNKILKPGKTIILQTEIKNPLVFKSNGKIIRKDIINPIEYINFKNNLPIKYNLNIINNFLEIKLLYSKENKYKNLELTINFIGGNSKFIISKNLFTDKLIFNVNNFNNIPYKNKFKFNSTNESDLVNFIISNNNKAIFNVTKSIKELKE